MSVDSISLVAQTAYNKAESTPVTDNSIENTVSFHKMVNTEFNRFATMSPDQILTHISGIKASQNMNNGSSIAGTVISNIRDKVNAHETTIKKSLINEASLLDIVTTTNQAKNTVQTLVTVRDKFMEAFDKIMNMSI